MNHKWTLLLLAVGVILVLFGVKGITGAVTVPGAGLMSRTSIVSVVGIIAIAGLVVATFIAHKK